MSATMVVRCAWCSRDLGVIACAPQQAGMISHGICQPCVAALEEAVA